MIESKNQYLKLFLIKMNIENLFFDKSKIKDCEKSSKTLRKKILP